MSARNCARTIPEVSQYNSANRGVVGMWPSYQEFRSLQISEGRLMTDEDEREGRRVVVLGSKAYRQLFPGQPAIGATVLVRAFPYIVVGVLQEKKQNSNYSGPDNDYLFAPYSAVSRDFPPPDKAWSRHHARISGRHRLRSRRSRRARRGRSAGAARLGTRASFRSVRQRRPLHLGHHGRRQDARQIFGVVTLFFGCVAIVTLCLGGIGVMNIMLVSVTERTREIGTRKAMGATKRDILRQFFAESAMLTVVSGSGLISAWASACSAGASRCPILFRIRLFRRFRLLLRF